MTPATAFMRPWTPCPLHTIDGSASIVDTPLLVVQSYGASVDLVTTVPTTEGHNTAQHQQTTNTRLASMARLVWYVLDTSTASTYQSTA